MGVSCAAANCIKSYFIDRDLYVQGNKIFRPINTQLDMDKQELTSEEKTSLENCMTLLKESEKTREDIAKKFEDFLYYTGACVLTQPTMERGLITYVVNLLTQINICANQKKVEFDKNDFALSNFIQFSKSSPFIELNQSTLDTLKEKYGFDFQNIESLTKGKESIINFISSIPNAKSLFNAQIDTLKNLSQNNLTSFFMLQQINKSTDGIVFLMNFFSEIYNGIVDTQGQLSKPRKIELFYKIASKAAEKKLKDPKEICLLFSLGDNCGKVENWKENITYKESDPVKY